MEAKRTEAKRIAFYTLTFDNGDGSSREDYYLSRMKQRHLCNNSDSDYIQDFGQNTLIYKGAVDLSTFVSTPHQSDGLIDTYLKYIKEFKDIGLPWKYADKNWWKLVFSGKRDYDTPLTNYFKDMEKAHSDIDLQLSYCGVHYFRWILKYENADIQNILLSKGIDLCKISELVEAYDNFDITLYFDLVLEVLHEFETKLVHNITTEFHLSINKTDLEQPVKHQLVRKFQVKNAEILDICEDFTPLLVTLYELKLYNDNQKIYNEY